MSKISTFKNDNVEFDLFAGAIIFVNFKRKFGKSLNEALAVDSSDMDALSFVVHEGYKCACGFKSAEVKLSQEDILNRLTIEDLLKCFQLLYPSDDQKKTK